MHSGHPDHHRSAARFFWAWLVIATLMSVAGNVTHALLIAPDSTRWLAAAAALVPPAVLISANHSISMLVRTQAGGRVYWVALVATVLLALGAFVLSFDALRSVAITVGTRTSIAWIWPAVIDVAIAHATLCLLSLTRPGHHSPTAATAPESSPVPKPTTAVQGESAMRTQPSTPTHVIDKPQEPRQLSAVPAGNSASPRPAPKVFSATPPVKATSSPTWRRQADSVLAATRLRQPAELVASVLAQNANGKRPSAIASEHQISHSTVQRIIAAATRVLGDDPKALTG